MQDAVYYEPTDHGYEERIVQWMETVKKLRGLKNGY
jgi:hypothetical protein